MFELPEYTNLARQMNETVRGRTIHSGSLGNSPHKFVWYNRDQDEFASLTQGKTIGKAHAKGRWLFIPLEPGYTLLFGECGGKILFHPAESEIPQKYHLVLTFTDRSFLTATTQMWGAMELYEQGEELRREYVKDMRPTPLDPDFSFEYFNNLIDELVAQKKRSAKSLLTQDQIIPGLGNAIAQDILFKAGLNPRRPLADLDREQRAILFNAINNTIDEIIDQGGRYDEFDLYGQNGSYTRIMDKNALKRPCPNCGGEIKKIQYLGGACYLCPNCQP
ncbi:MAG TPA: DNA-formamidopyrimidine glycosylase family protein [Anaerolineales bacterium]|nr:DNA-formamidopyrimidine glycosylase family protein [Anaerolineales bacterium]